MNYKSVAFFDLDGTLLNDEGQIEKPVKKAIDKLKENGILPVINTGRSLPHTRKAMKASGITSVISLNGQYIIHNGEIVYENIIPTSTVERFIQFAKRLGHLMKLFSGEQVYATQIPQKMIDQHNSWGISVPQLATDMSNIPVHQLLPIFSDTKLDQDYQEEFGDELTFFRNSPGAIDVISKGVDKGVGAMRFIEHMGLQGVQTYGFGDGLNDIALLKTVDFGVAMENGHEEVKAVANYITKKNTEGGIIQALEHFQLL
ncbi:MAG: Cof-type HAD-IIB family hydrolase [Streptococcaceae bacterium]|jgi:Cof subfamily protein (haloacid dehalogenase superfamily)|nr:Cof-type HAD-IIB family hydrolase [Streptococcaceae bacterium]